uniref:holo-[acyl-carrier-protein] synthase n=1 Tax=Crithidia acanthocephali TaxID=59798 RepID=T1YTE0_9TRYP|nr:holo-acyl-carrier-protein synthase [Crithidia acanthocephali]
MFTFQVTTMKVIFVNAAQWQPSREEFLAALHQLHSKDSVRCATEEGQRELSNCPLPQHTKAVKSRLLARHLLVQQLLNPGDSSSPLPMRKKSQVLLPTTLYGKPLTMDAKPGDFSVSHEPNWVCCAYTASGTIGVDITPIRSEDCKLLGNILSQREADALRYRAVSLQPPCFALYWSLKECVLKALGLGLSTSLQMHDITLEFDVDAETLARMRLSAGSRIDSFTQPLKVTIRGSHNAGWAFSYALIEDDPLHLICVVKQGEDGGNKVEWRFQSCESVLRC